MKTWTTLNELKKAEACTERYHHLCKALGGINNYGKDTPIAISKILELNGLDDALWAMRCVDESFARLCACAFARSVLHIYEDKYPGDNRPRKAIETAELFAYGETTRAELAAARDAAWDAAGDAAGAAAWAARAAAGDAAGDAARAAERKKQAQIIRELEEALR